jgi:hypothetical protein
MHDAGIYPLHLERGQKEGGFRECRKGNDWNRFSLYLSLLNRVQGAGFYGSPHSWRHSSRSEGVGFTLPGSGSFFFFFTILLQILFIYLFIFSFFFYYSYVHTRRIRVFMEEEINSIDPTSDFLQLKLLVHTCSLLAWPVDQVKPCSSSLEVFWAFT